MANPHEIKFTKALRDIFVGARIEGESGYINLMKMKSRYFTEGVFPRLMEKIDEELEPFPTFREELFDKLYSFFKRYFSESGSIYFRHTPYYQDIYERIYTDDRDVMLFWKTQNLYYVKTDRLFRSLTLNLDDAPDQKYAFDASAVAGKSFSFDATGLQNKQNNEKRSLIFEYKGKNEKDDTLRFAVQYSKGATKTKTAEILKAIKKDGIKVSEDQLTRSFRLFERQSEVDFFINKNAKAFLNEQFDLWMYQYLFKHESEFIEKRIKQMQALKRVAYAIIEFISQFEDELVRLWNKPKFALGSNYIITFDRVFEKSEMLARKLIEHSGIRAQIDEWEQLGVVEGGFSVEQIFEVEPTNGKLAFVDESESSTFGTLNSKLRYLPFDTKYFKSLEIEILSLFDNLDDELDGRLISSENYQALNTLKTKLGGQIKTVYVDPPYNTAASEIDYLNSYKHSSWLSMMHDRLELAKELLDSTKGFICCTIDDVEQKSLSQVIEKVFGEVVGTVAIRVKPSGRPIPNGFAISHEYAIFSRTCPDYPVARLEHTEEQRGRYKERDEKEAFFWELFRKAGSNSNRANRPTMYFPFFLDLETKEMRLPLMSFDEQARQYVLKEDKKASEVEIYPRKDDGSEGVWYFGYERSKLIAHELKAEPDGNGSYKVYYRRRHNEGVQPTTVWVDAKYSATEHGTALLKHLFGEQETFAYPKSIFAVIDCLKVTGASEESDAIYADFFGGSGTTAHAIINLNREDGGVRKYVLVEANEYFYTVILPRVKKVVYSDKWKDGKAGLDGKGISHFCKYFALEQYEDTLRRSIYLDDSKTDTPSFFNNPYESPFSSYVFLRDKKMSDALKTDYKANKICVDFAKLYEDIDWAETLSCIKGKFIKAQTAESVTFADGETIKFDEIDYRDILPLIWWDK